MMVDSDDGPSIPAPSLKRKKILVISSDEDEEPVKSPPKKKVAVTKPTPKAVVSASTSKASVSAGNPKKNGKASTKSKRSKDDEFVVNSSEEEEEETEESDDDYEDDEEVKPVKKGKSKPPANAKLSPKKAPPQKAPATKAADKGKGKEEDVKPPAKPFKYANLPHSASDFELRDAVGPLLRLLNSLDRPLLARNRFLSLSRSTVSSDYLLFSQVNSVASREMRQ